MQRRDDRQPRGRAGAQANSRSRVETVTSPSPKADPPRHESRLAALAFVGQFVAYLMSVLLARHLGVEGFQAYAVASAVFILMAVVAPLGAEKYALRLLPVLIERGDWARARGYMRFGMRRTLQMVALLGTAVLLWAWWAPNLADATRLAIVFTVLSLPAGAVVHYGLEVLSAWSRDFIALALFRIVVPGLALLFVCLLLLSPLQVSGAMAIACWGLAWGLAMLLMAWQMRRTVPAGFTGVPSIEEPDPWNAALRPFFFYRISLGVLGQSGVIALDWLQPSATATGAYAAAASTVGLVAVLATATNRAYARQLSLLLERRQYALVLALRRKRLRWLLPLVAAFVLASFVFTDEILALFRAEFVAEGALALRLLALATAFTVLFALAPTYLKYRGRNRATYVAVACTAVLQLLLLLLLVPRWGTSGAAIAHAFSMSALYAALAWMARCELLLLSSGEE